MPDEVVTYVFQKLVQLARYQKANLNVSTKGYLICYRIWCFVCHCYSKMFLNPYNLKNS